MQDGADAETTLGERDLRALAMELAMQLPRNEREADYVLRLMRVGYDYFLCESKPENAAEADVIRPKFSARRREAC